MELQVVEATGVPEDCYLSIRCGETRRQAPLQTSEPFRFNATTPDRVQLDLFRKVGSAKVRRIISRKS